MQNLNLTVHQYCNTILNAEFPTFAQHRQQAYKQMNLSYLTKARNDYEEAKAAGTPLTADEQEALKDKYEQEDFAPYLEHYLNGWSIVVNSMVELGLAQELVSSAIEYYTKWHEYESVSALIIAINNNCCDALGLPRITPRDLKSKHKTQESEESTKQYADYVALCQDIKQEVELAKVELKACKSRHALTMAQLKELHRTELEQLKLKQQGEMNDLVQEHCEEQKHLKTIIARKTPATFSAYKASIESEIE